MTIHIPVRPPRIVALGGPVSSAIRAMRADEPATDYARIRELRRAIADRIEADIALLDALDPFADEREAEHVRRDLGPNGRMRFIGVSSDDEPSLCGLGAEHPHCGGDDREEEDEREPCVDGEPSLCGITVNALFATGAAMSACEAEPSLASLGGTAEGCDQSQDGWSKGDGFDREEEDGGGKTHRREGLWREPGPALDEARAWARKTRYGRRDYLTIAGPHGGTYLCRAMGRR